METCLSKNPNINVVYTINEPAAYGAYQALKSAGKEKDVTIVSVDGGCAGVGYVEEGVIGATSQQYPLRMAPRASRPSLTLATDGTKPEPTEGLDFYDTGVALVTGEPQDGVESIDTDEGEVHLLGLTPSGGGSVPPRPAAPPLATTTTPGRACPTPRHP